MSFHARIALFFYVVLGLTLKNTWGLFHPIGLIVLSLAFVLFCWFTLRNQQADAGEQFPSTAATLSTLLAFNAFLLWLGSFDPKQNPAGLVYVVEGSWLDSLRARTGPLALFLAAGTAQWFMVVVWKRVPMSVFYVCVAILLGIVSWQRLAVLKASPAPFIDTFEVNNAACDYLLKGKNPYAKDIQYKDIYRGGYDYRAGFPYWPTYLYWSVPFRAFFGDVRYGTWAADLITALLLWATARRLGLDFKTAWLVPLVWLSFPVSLFVLEQAWIDPVLIMTTTALLWALVARQWAMVGLALGLVCGVKQYGVLLAAFTLIYVLQQQRQGFVRTLGWMALALAVLFVPFLVLDAHSFYERTVEVYLNPTLRSDALSWPSAAKQFWQSEYAQRKGLQDRIAAMQPPNWFLPACYLAVVACGGLWIARAKQPGLKIWAAVLPFSLGTIFLFGKLAFCNYYYYVAFLVLVYLLLCLSPESADNSRKSKVAPSLP